MYVHVFTSTIQNLKKNALRKILAQNPAEHCPTNEWSNESITKTHGYHDVFTVKKHTMHCHYCPHWRINNPFLVSLFPG